jgi:hypothetical protein
LAAENGGGMNVTASRDVASLWETFKVRCPTTACAGVRVIIHRKTNIKSSFN